MRGKVRVVTYSRASAGSQETRAERWTALRFFFSILSLHATHNCSLFLSRNLYIPPVSLRESDRLEMIRVLR